MAGRARAWRRVTMARPVIVNLRDGGAIRALALVPLAGGAMLELRQAHVIPAGGDPGGAVAADGVLIVPLERVDFVQVL